MKRVLVLGGGSDIGSAIVKALSVDNDVVWTFHKTYREQPGRAINCDLTDIDDLGRTLGNVGSVDLLVTAAFPFLECENSDFVEYMRAEKFLRAHVFTMTLMLHTMNPEGKIVNVLGQCVERGLPGAAFYSAAFAFLHNFGNSINAREGKAGKVSVCDLLLGPVDTREWDGLSQEIVKRYKSKMLDFISPEQVADTVRFLTSQRIMPSIFKLDGYYGY